MNERLASFWDAVKAWWERLSRIGRTLFIVAAGVIVVAIVALVIFFNSDEPEYALLYNDLSTTETARVLSILSESQIVPHVEPNGNITVLLADVDEARVLLAASGFQTDTFDYSVYAPGMTATQADKDRYERWQLQDRIQAEIETTYEDVSQAVVNLSVPKENSFAFKEDLEPPAAAVVLTMRPEKTLTTAQIDGVVNMVMHSVPGLTEDKVSIMDQAGDVRSRVDSNVDINNNKLQLKADFDELTRQKVLRVLEHMYGPGNVEVQANSMLDTDESVAEKITYEPFDAENPMNNPVDYAEYIRDWLGPADQIVQGVVGANDNVQTPQYGQDLGQPADPSGLDTHDILDYLVSSTKEQIKNSGFDVTSMTVAVVVNQATLADGERDELISLAAMAAGVPPENVSVVNRDFFAPADPVTSGATQPESIATWMIIVGIILLIIIIALIVIAFLLANKKKKDEEEAGLEEEEVLYDEDGMPIGDLFGEEEDFEPITIIETQEQKLRGQIKDLAESDPEIVANLLKTWLQ